MTFDEIRQLHPGVGLSLYAITPGGAVTLELIDHDGVIYSTVGMTAEAALAAAFPAEIAEPEPETEKPFNVFD